MSAERMSETFRITAPIELTQIVRDQISTGRRVVEIRNTGLPGRVTIHTLPAYAHIEGQMQIPNQNKPHAIFESLEPIEA